MSVVAEFRLPQDEFALAETFSTEPNLVVELERAAATPPDQVFSTMWTLPAEVVVEPLLEDDPTIESATRLAQTDSGRLYTVAWATEVQARVEAVLDLDVTILRFVGDSCGWHAQIRAPRHEDLSEFQELVTDADIELELERVHRPRTPTTGDRTTLTTKQREAVSVAVELGFYEVPRAASMGTVAEHLGISQQALSKRLRRAHAAIIGETVSGRGADAAVPR